LKFPKKALNPAECGKILHIPQSSECFLLLWAIGKRTFLTSYFIGKRTFFALDFIGKRTSTNIIG
jgi:hypothetical protein